MINYTVFFIYIQLSKQLSYLQYNIIRIYLYINNIINVLNVFLHAQRFKVYWLLSSSSKLIKWGYGIRRLYINRMHWIISFSHLFEYLSVYPTKKREWFNSWSIASGSKTKSKYRYQFSKFSMLYVKFRYRKYIKSPWS